MDSRRGYVLAWGAGRGPKGKIGPAGAQGATGPAGQPFNFSVTIIPVNENNLTATPSVGAVGDYTYAWAHSDNINIGGTIILTTPGNPNDAVLQTSQAATDCYGMIVCIVTHTVTGTISSAYIFIKLSQGI